MQALRWIVLLPLIGAAINLTLGSRIQRSVGRAGVAVLGSGMALASFAIAVTGFLKLRALEPESRLLLDNVLPWLHVGSLNVSLAFQLDPLSAVMVLVVTGIGSLIHIYSFGYMDEDPALWRFFGLLNLFLFAMLTLVLGDNILVMFVGWEGVGLCSWALIGFWYKDHANTAAANKAFLFNRIGDFAFLCGTMLLFWSLAGLGHATLVFRELDTVVGLLEGHALWGVPVATLATLLLFIGATGKSAQIPLYVWLPDAMAGPTPVSALIHAATMVTAGVYMVSRLHCLFSLAPFTLNVIAVVGTTTAIFAATIAVTQHDIKKVLAYSTVSQLGYMFVALGCGAYAAGVFHLVTHAFFKACLFLGAGSVIHASHHEQDMRRMGGLRTKMPLTFWTFLVSTMAIAGLPPLAGFFSKDEILLKAYQHDPLLWGVGLVTAGLTAFYMFRQVFLVFFGESRAGASLDPHASAHAADHHGHHVHEVHESSAAMTLPLVLLACGALTAGWLGIPSALGGNNLFTEWLSPVFASGGEHHGVEHEGLELEYALMVVSVLVALAGITLAYLVYLRKSLNADTFSRIARGVPYRLSFNKYYVDEFYYGTVLAGTLALSRALGWFDKVIIDGVVNGAAASVRAVSILGGGIDKVVVDGLVNFTARAFNGVGGALRLAQTGNINAYVYVLLIGVTAVLLAGAW